AQWVIVRDLHQYDLHSVGVSDPGFDESPVFCSGLAQHGNAVLLKTLILNLNIANLHPQRKLWCGRWCFSLASNFKQAIAKEKHHARTLGRSKDAKDGQAKNVAIEGLRAFKVVGS